jgi:branched-chain amino acid transport system ATP-binding protein
VVDRIAEALLWERKRRGTTMLIVEQNVSFALKVADRYLLMKQGEIVQHGDARDAGAADTIFEHLKV